MQKIRRLPESLVNRIAAGEVIERPAAVVKELVENSLDAEATEIEVFWQNGGQSLITVTDNGVGMSREDLMIAIERHATSKLPEDDLWNIQSFGFRGEALPSIGAVSRLSITSRKQNLDTAWQIEVEGGKIKEPQPASLAKGTHVKVSDLFFATPARLKFLKSARTESINIREILDKLALANPQVTFILRENGKKPTVYRASPNITYNRIKEVLGEQFLENAYNLDFSHDYLKITGFACAPAFHQQTGREQYLFVNNRPVRDKFLFAAVRAAYGDLLPSGRFPSVVLFLTLPPREVDVNVHPTKAEVRFRDATFVRNAVINALKTSLTHPKKAISDAFSLPKFMAKKLEEHSSNVHRLSEFQDSAEQQLKLPNDIISFRQAIIPLDIQKGYRLGTALVQIQGTFILSITDEGLIIVDQHAAHERIVYEKIKQQLKEGKIESQFLLIPEVIEMKETEIEAITSKTEELAKFGFSLEKFGSGSILVREIPALLDSENLKELLLNLASFLLEYDATDNVQEKLDHICATLACHSSIRAGRNLTPEEMNALLREMEKTPGFGQCSHGRPSYIELKKDDLEKLFRRK